MSALPLAILRTGLVTGVGLDAPATCAAIRGAVENFQATRFRDQGGQWLMGCQVPLEEPVRGARRLLAMAARAIRECLAGFDHAQCEATPLLLCLPETHRRGRVVADDGAFFLALQDALGFRFHAGSSIIAGGRVSAALALNHARQLLADRRLSHVLVAACDSLLTPGTLEDHERRDRLMTSEHSDGFIAGEAAAALLVERLRVGAQAQLACHGLGFAVERAHIDSEQPLRGEGLATAIRQSLADAACPEGILEFKIIDASGGEYAFKEAALAFARLDRGKREVFDVWHPADCIGEVGAPIGLVMVAVLKAACEKAYAKGRHVLLHMGNDDGRRASMIFAWH